MCVATDVYVGTGGAESVFRALLRLPTAKSAVIALSTGNLPSFAGAISVLSRVDPWSQDGHQDILERLLVTSSSCQRLPSPTIVSHHHSGLLLPTVPERTVYYLHTPTRFLWEPETVPWEAGAAHAQQSELRRREQRVATAAAALLTNSFATGCRIAKYYGRAATIVYPPVDLWQQSSARMPPELPPYVQTGRYMLYVGRLAPGKRVELLLSAAAANGLAVVIVGTGRSEGRLRESAGHMCWFAGWRPAAQLRWLYRHAAGYAATSVEDFGISVAEALCEGTPCIIPDGSGVSELVSDLSCIQWDPHAGVTALTEAVATIGDLPRLNEGAISLIRRRLSLHRFLRDVGHCMTATAD